MTCQRCQDEAVVHLTELVDGRRKETHLCVACARASGLSLPDAPPDFGLDAVLQDLIKKHVGELVGELAESTCPDCRLRYMDFRTGGRLGCPHDYQVFRKGLLPMLQRFHGATRHVGKRARARPGASLRLRLRSQLRQAVAREDYEEAARLRDQIRLKDQHA
ncbi:UvrB/UvrC motif-containing protein [Paludisphaera mucosa]|uniref:UvrB/UvrC motif-containing protein n=1 Tax=Paludisphaera mucosa TaxID=3030827 RepID=A0ABT6FFY0_9BACT|nr:UvrB/UvrC motif-containing protein [Paludisphaera mucosa]MDG3006485.1 UvrB/UvrC motif-containing protein [Paludisphaera mucosa]